MTRLVVALWSMFALVVAGVAWVIGREEDCYGNSDDDEGDR